MINNITLIGRLTRDVDLRYTSNGTPVTNFTLAVERNYKNKQGEKETDFIKIVTWRGLAETCAEHLGKGRLVAVDGRLQIKKRENNGKNYINPEVVANNVQFLDWPSNNSQQKSKNDTQSNQKNNQRDEDFDVPF